MNISVVSSTVCAIFVHFTIYNVNHNLPKIINIPFFSISVGFQNANFYCFFGDLACPSIPNYCYLMASDVR